MSDDRLRVLERKAELDEDEKAELERLRSRGGDWAAQAVWTLGEVLQSFLDFLDQHDRDWMV